MKILKVDKDKVQVELTREEIKTIVTGISWAAGEAYGVLLKSIHDGSFIVSLADEIKCKVGEPMGIKFAD